MAIRKSKSSRSGAVTRVLQQATDSRALVVAHALLFASGALALIYELLWLRRFTVLFGASAPAASATLSAIFFGFAIGSAMIGARAPRLRKHWRAYGLLEIGIGLAALPVAPLLSLYGRFYGSLYLHFAHAPAVFLAIKTVLAMAAILLPCLLMGGSVPLLSQAFAGARERAGIIGSSFYAVNIAGAVIGAVSVPFLLLPVLGARGSYFGAIAGNLLIGLLALLVSTRQEAQVPAEIPEIQTLSAEDRTATSLLSHAQVALLAFLSGLLTIMLEILWTRMLAQVHENSIYSFAIVTAVFLVGLTGGAMLARLLAARFRIDSLLGIAWAAAGLLVFVSPQLFYLFSDGLNYLSDSDHNVGLQTLWLAAAIMLLPLLAAGMILPLLIKFTGVGLGGQFAPRLGRLLAINTAGAIIGPLLATYLLLPTIGLWWSIILVAIAMIVGGELALGNFSARGPASVRRAITIGLLVVLALLWNSAHLPRVRIKAEEDGEKLLHVQEGSHGIVAVMENNHDRWMLLDNFYTLGGTASSVEERQQAQIPLLLHPAPRRVAFLGMGTAITASGALLLGVEKITALELVPEVVTTARDYFAEANLNFLHDARVEVVNEDARIYLRNSGQQYDVIIGDLVVPWRQGEASLFTREQFQTARAALAPDGIFCQWLPLFQLSEEQFQIIAATFLDVFPNTTLWRGDFFADVPAVALIGHTAAAPLNSETIAVRMTAARNCCAHNSPLLAHQAGLWMYLVGALNGAQPRFAGARRNSENEPWIELLSSRAGATAKFTSRPLGKFFDEVRAAPITGGALANLGTLPLYWRDGGAAIWEASLLITEGRDEEGNHRAMEGLEMMPTELQKAITGEPVAPSGHTPH